MKISKLNRNLLNGILLWMAFNTFMPINSNATHLRAADVIVERICGTLTFQITITAYMNSQSTTRFGTGGELIFGDGQVLTLLPIAATLRPDLGEDISVATFTTTHTYQASGLYTITYLERDRSRGVLNIADSEDTPYVTFVTIDTDSKYGCNHYPVLSVIPLDRACSGVIFFHNSGAYDVDGDSLSYEMTIPSSSPVAFAVYRDPNNPIFYTNYNTGNEAGNGPPTFAIDAFTGLVTLDAPGLMGEYNIAFKIIEWRKDMFTGQYARLSTTTRDMQIVVEECDNARPDLIVPNDTCVVAGTILTGIIKGIDAENHPVKIEVFSEVLTLQTNPASYAPNPPAFVPSDSTAELTIEWKTDCLHVRQQVYQMVFKITDDPPDGPKLVTFKTWNISVVAPAPLWEDASLDLVNRYTQLQWGQYSCENAYQIQVWRKVGAYPYSPDNCKIGIPGYLGYQLVGETSSSATAFTDTNFGMGLAPGAQYCYRLVALIADTKSVVSDEICIGPIITDAPVITHVSVEKTAPEGSIRVSWRTPFKIDKEQFPEPYEYEIYRAEGFIGDTSLVKVIDHIRDTTFLDTSIQTEEKVFNYRVVLYAQPQHANIFIPIDTSSIASSVRLQAISEMDEIKLHWKDSVPWSNVVAGRPYHLVYRAAGLTSDEDMVLIDSVAVTLDGFRYSDKGQYNNMPLEKNRLYSYKVLTRGTYGNPAISLQENFSQRVSVYPSSDLLPCLPSLAVEITDCEEYASMYSCTTPEFINTMYWSIQRSADCLMDIKAYNIYRAATMVGEFVLVATVQDTSFIDIQLTSFARCYRVSAIDLLDREGPLSEPVCNDNCPYYELPNVFTPNADECNDFFGAPSTDDDAAPCHFGEIINCPRFTQSVTVKIYNRWGKEVYQYRSDNEKSIYVDWNGKDDRGDELASGIYYYYAVVTFDVIDPAKRTKEIKGWVHLSR